MLAHHIYEVQKIQKTHQIHNASPKAPGTENCTHHDVSNQINSRCTNEDIKCLPGCRKEYRTSHKVNCGHIHTIEHSHHTVWGGHVPQVPQWHNASAYGFISSCRCICVLSLDTSNHQTEHFRFTHSDKHCYFCVSKCLVNCSCSQQLQCLIKLKMSKLY